MTADNIGFTGTYFNSICLTIAAFVFIVLVVFMYIKKDKVKGLTTKLFITTLVLNLSCIILEIIVPLSIKEIIATNDNASIIHYIICKSYLVIALLWDLVYLLYVSVKVQNVKFFYNEEKNKYNKYAIIIYSVFLIASIAFVFLFDMEYVGGVNKSPYTIAGTAKVLFDIFTTVGSTYIIVAFTIYNFKINNINMSQFYYVFAFYLVFLALEYIFDFKFNHLAFVQSLIILTTYFTMESQDNKLLLDYNKAKEESEKADKVKTNLLINLSHEIRTPMSTIMGLGDGIVNENIINEASFKDDFSNITKASYVLLDLVDKISYISKLDGGKVEINDSDYYLNNLVNDVFYNIYNKSQENNIHLSLNIDNNIPKMYTGDSKKVYEILYYILLNAINHISGGEIKLSINGIKKENNKIDMEYVIEHSGEFLNRDLFDNDIDALDMSNNLKDNSTYNSDMTIIIVRLLVRLLKGKIELNNDNVNETKYVIKIEQTIKDNTPIGNISLDQIINNIKSQSLLDCTGKTVLFVDSNNSIVRIATNYLEQYHFNVVVANDVSNCINNFKTQKYDIIFADYTMDNGSGKTIMDELIALGVPLPTMVALIEDNAKIDKDEFNKGYDFYVTKPIVFNNLNNTIHKIYDIGGDK